MYLVPRYSGPGLSDSAMERNESLQMLIVLLGVARVYASDKVCTWYRYRSEIPFLQVFQICPEVAANQYSGTHQRVDAD